MGRMGFSPRPSLYEVGDLSWNGQCIYWQLVEKHAH